MRGLRPLLGLRPAFICKIKMNLMWGNRALRALFRPAAGLFFKVKNNYMKGPISIRQGRRPAHKHYYTRIRARARTVRDYYVVPHYLCVRHTHKYYPRGHGPLLYYVQFTPMLGGKC